MQDSIKYKDGRYELGIPWKGDPKCRLDNYDMAVKRMINTERNCYGMLKLRMSTTRLLKIKLHYVKVLEKDPESESKKWYLRHFQLSNQIKKQQRQELYLTLLQLKMVQV